MALSPAMVPNPFRFYVTSCPGSRRLHGALAPMTTGNIFAFQVTFNLDGFTRMQWDNLFTIEVKNGKVISDGDKSVVVGLAFPGLKSV